MMMMRIMMRKDEFQPLQHFCRFLTVKIYNVDNKIITTTAPMVDMIRGPSYGSYRR